MNKTYTLILTALFLFSCVEAPSNGRKGPDAPRDGADVELPNPSCPTCVKVVAAVPSMIYRVKGTSQITYTELVNLIIKNKVPKDYQLIPNPNLSTDDQINQTAKNYENCGISKNLSGVDARINSCSNIHIKFLQTGESDRSYWSAKTNGISGEADWQLVLNNQDEEKAIDVTLWKNTRTGLIWSNVLPNTEDWNIASGSESKLDDSICSVLEKYTEDHVKWRLPNRNEFLMADISGARFVLGNTEKTFWTASSVSGSNELAWLIEQSSGILSKAAKYVPKSIRCIGEVIK